MNRLLSRKSLLLAAMVVVNLVNASVGLMGNAVSEDINRLLKEHGLEAYRVHLTAGLVITGLLVAAWAFKAEKDEEQDETADDEDVPEAERAPRAFLRDLTRRYRKRIAHKLDGRYEISLVVSDDLEGTRARWFDEELGADAHAGEAARYIIERFESRGRLLIVGGPGSGKTVLLLALALDLAAKAREDSAEPLPVIFNLDSWSSDYARFDDWAKAMLTKGYGLSPDFAGQLLAEQRIVFLLDGLDELARNEEPARAARVRAECLAALDKSLHDGSLSTVICCRREQFEEMLAREGAEPPVAAVVAVQDLTPEQIDHALVRAGSTRRDKFAAPHLRAALRGESGGVYRRVLSTPFYFTTALQVFDSTRPPAVDASSRRALEENLVRAFVEKKLEVTTSRHAFPPAKTLAWLKWLAGFLDKGERVMFELSDLQPSTLRRPWQYRLLFCFVFGVAGSLILTKLRIVRESMSLVFLFGLAGSYMLDESLTQWTFEPLRRWRTWRNFLWPGLLVGALLSAALSFGMIWTVGAKEVAIIHIVALLIYVVISVTFGLLLTVVVAAFALLIIRLFVGTFSGKGASSILTEDFAQWMLSPLRRWHTWRNILGQGLATGLLGCIIGGGSLLIAGIVLIIERAFGFGSSRPLWQMIAAVPLFVIFGALLGMPAGGVIGTLLGIFRACRKTARFAKIKSPYQRLRAGIVFNVIQFIVVALSVVGLVLTSQVLLNLFGSEGGFPTLSEVAKMVLPFGLLGLFRTSILKHAVLRVCLTLEGTTPLRYATFLNYATALRVMERDGGQWRFRHQILQDHFAGVAPKERDAPAKTEPITLRA